MASPAYLEVVTSVEYRVEIVLRDVIFVRFIRNVEATLLDDDETTHTCISFVQNLCGVHN